MQEHLFRPKGIFFHLFDEESGKGEDGEVAEELQMRDAGSIEEDQEYEDGWSGDLYF